MRELAYPMAVEEGNVIYSVDVETKDLIKAIRNPDGEGYLCVETKFPDGCSGLLAIFLCNLDGKTSIFRRFEFAYNCKRCKKLLFRLLRRWGNKMVSP